MHLTNSDSDVTMIYGDINVWDQRTNQPDVSNTEYWSKSLIYGALEWKEAAWKKKETKEVKKKEGVAVPRRSHRELKGGTD